MPIGLVIKCIVTVIMLVFFLFCIIPRWRKEKTYNTLEVIIVLGCASYIISA